MRPKQIKAQAKENTFRIIAGKWRSRRLVFAKNPAIRPSPDRVRETVFNWLQTTVPGSRCLDCFAGSGALGFEALSRGASFVEFVDLDAATVANLQSNIKLLDVGGCSQAKQMDALQFLTVVKQQYQLVFLDPPFRKDLLEPCLTAIAASQEKGCLVYVETELEYCISNGDFAVLKEKTAGQVKYQLLQRL